MPHSVAGPSAGVKRPLGMPVTLCGTFVETDDATGRARRAVAVRVGGRLSPAALDNAPD